MKNRLLTAILFSLLVLSACSPEHTATVTTLTVAPPPTESSTEEAEPAEEIEPTEPSVTTIMIDGDSADWSTYDVSTSDPEGDTVDGDFDIAAVSALINDTYLYVLVEPYAPASNYMQVDIVINTGSRRFLTSLLPGMGAPPLGELTTGDYVEIGPQESFDYTFGEVVEARFPLSVFDNPETVTLEEVRIMNGECCAPPDWYAVDALSAIPVAIVNEVETVAEGGPSVDYTLPFPPPEAVTVIEQTQMDLSHYRCDEPTDIVTNSDRSMAYTICRNVDILMVIDTGTDQVVNVLSLHDGASHPFGPSPTYLAITPDDSTLLIANEMDRSITFVDTASLSITAYLPVDGIPKQPAISPDSTTAYVVAPQFGGFMVVDLAQHEIVTRMPLGPGVEGPYAVAFAPDGSAAYVAAINGGMWRIDPATCQVSGHVDLPQAGGRGDMVISGDGSKVYLAAEDSDWIAEIDTGTMQVTRQFDVPNPLALMFNEDESRLYFSIFNAFTELQPMEVIDLAAGEIVEEIVLRTPAPHVSWPAEIDGFAFVGDGSRIYAPVVDADSIVVLDAETNSQSGVIPLIDYAIRQPEHLVISSDGATLYTVNIAPQAPSISMVDTSSGEATTLFYLEADDPCFGQASSLDITPDDTTLYVSTDTCLLTFDIASATFTASTPVDLPAGHSILDLAVSPDNSVIYLVDSEGVVSVIGHDSMAVTTSVQAVDEGYNIKVSPDGTRVYVTGLRQYAAIDTADYTVIVSEAVITLGLEQFSAYPDRLIGIPPGHEFYTIGDFDLLHVYDTSTNQLLRTISLEPWAPGRTLATDAIFSPDGSTGYLALWDLKGIAAFDTTTWELLAQIDTGLDPVYGVCPNDFAFAPDGSTLYVSFEQADSIAAIDIATHTISEVYSLLNE
nr:hypothetical protein [Anaerolineae bacterium]